MKKNIQQILNSSSNMRRLWTASIEGSEDSSPTVDDFSVATDEVRNFWFGDWTEKKVHEGEERGNENTEPPPLLLHGVKRTREAGDVAPVEMVSGQHVEGSAIWKLRNWNPFPGVVFCFCSLLLPLFIVERRYRKRWQHKKKSQGITKAVTKQRRLPRRRSPLQVKGYFSFTAFWVSFLAHKKG